MIEHREYEEWLQAELDGELGDAERAALDRHVAECARCAAERGELERLGGLIRSAAAPVRPDFRSAVMSSLPAAGWESRHPRTWALPLAMLAVCGATAAILMGVSAARLEPGGPLAGALGALASLLGSSLLAGAGLIAASWRGVGLAASALAGRSPLALAALGVGVLCLNLLVWRLLRGRRAAPGLAHRGRG